MGRVHPAPTGPPPHPCETPSGAKYPPSCPPPAAPGGVDLGSSAGKLLPTPVPPPPKASVGAAVPGQRFKWGAEVWETGEGADACSPNADAGLVPLSAADSFPALKSTHHPTLTSHPPWGGRRVPFIRLIPSPPSAPPPKETGYFLANLYASNFHINKTKVMIRGFFSSGLLYFSLHSRSVLSPFPLLPSFPRFQYPQVSGLTTK